MNLHSKHLKTLQMLFSKHPAITQALLFGSRALGTHKESSDIDIALKGDITPTLLAHLKEELEDSTLPYFCDILDYERAPQELKEHIDTHALTLYKREEEWQEVRLGDVATRITSGGTPPTTNEENYNGGIPWLNTKEVKNCRIYKTEKTISDLGLKNSSAKWIEKDSIIVAMYGATAGKVAINKIPLTTNQACCNITINSLKADYRFVYYSLLNQYERLTALASGAAQQNLNVSTISNLTIPLPPLERQKEIAEILSSFDDKIDFLHRQNRTLESLAQTLFRHYFIENAKEEWEEKPLSEIATFLNGLACQKIPPKNDLDKLPVLKIKELREGKILDSSDWATSEVEYRYIVNQGDIIFSWSATLMVEIWGGEKCVLNQHLFKVIADKGYPQWFCYFWCKYHLESFISIAKAHATTMGHIRRQDLDNAICRIPSQEFINKFDSEVSPLMLKLAKNFKEVTALKNTYECRAKAMDK